MQLRLGVKTNVVVVRQGLEDFKNDIPKVGKLRMYRLSQRVVTKLKVTPTELPNQKYKRTGQYIASWEIDSLVDGYLLVNEVTDSKGRPYASRVAGNAYGQKQSPYQAGRWSHLRTTVDEELAIEPAEAAAALRLVARKDLSNRTSI